MSLQHVFEVPAVQYMVQWKRTHRETDRHGQTLTNTDRQRDTDRHAQTQGDMERHRETNGNPRIRFKSLSIICTVNSHFHFAMKDLLCMSCQTEVHIKQTKADLSSPSDSSSQHVLPCETSITFSGQTHSSSFPWEWIPSLLTVYVLLHFVCPPAQSLSLHNEKQLSYANRSNRSPLHWGPHLTKAKSIDSSDILKSTCGPQVV